MNVIEQIISDPIDFYCRVKNIMEVNGNQNSLVTNILQMFYQHTDKKFIAWMHFV